MSHSEEGENYWPGYVDALTSMVQVLAFVMIMLAMAVFVISQSVSKHSVEAIAKAVNADVKPNADLKQLTQAIVDKLQQLQSAAPASASNKPATPPAEAAASKPAAPANAAKDAGSEKIVETRMGGAQPRNDPTAIQIPSDAPRLRVDFEEHSFKIAQERAQSVAKFIDQNKVVEQGQIVIINAYAYSGDGALSEARRLAYYRAMTARKQLVDQKVKADGIRINVNDTADKDKGSTVELTVAGNRAH
jgi:ribosomal protein L12E/L44/L45/RPP1/RPP2